MPAATHPNKSVLVSPSDRSIIEPDNECTTPVTTPPKMMDSITRFGIRLTPARNSPKNLSTFAVLAEMKVMERQKCDTNPPNCDQIDGPSSDWVKRGEAALATAFYRPLYRTRKDSREARDPHAALASLGHLHPLDVREEPPEALENPPETREGTPGMHELLASLGHLYPLGAREDPHQAREPHASLASLRHLRDDNKKPGVLQRVFSTLKGRRGVVRPKLVMGKEKFE